MTAVRFLPASDYHQLKGASRVLVTHAGGPKLVTAELTRGSEARMSEALAHNAGHRFLGIDQVADLEAHVGEPFVTRCLADLAGCDLVARPKAGVPERSYLRHLTAVITETGDVGELLADALADGRISPAERAGLKTAIGEAHAVLAALAARLDQGDA